MNFLHVIKPEDILLYRADLQQQIGLKIPQTDSLGNRSINNQLSQNNLKHETDRNRSVPVPGYLFFLYIPPCFSMQSNL